jgi:protein-tyrosine phosphatase
VIDLRSRKEIDVAVHPLAAVADVHHVALGESLHPERVAATPAAERDLAWAYRLIVLEATAELARIVRIVASASGPVLVHCAAGKDRTGIVVAVLLRAAGVRRDDVMADYLRTNDNLERLWARLTAAGAHLPSNSDALFGVDARVLAAPSTSSSATRAGSAATCWRTAPHRPTSTRSPPASCADAPVRGNPRPGNA